MLLHKDVEDAVATFFVENGWSKKESTIHSDLIFTKNGEGVSVECKGDFKSGYDRNGLQQFYCGIGQCVYNLPLFDDVFLAIPKSWDTTGSPDVAHVFDYIPIGLFVVDEDGRAELKKSPKISCHRHSGELRNFAGKPPVVDYSNEMGEEDSADTWGAFVTKEDEKLKLLPHIEKRKLIKVGNSMAVTLPKPWLEWAKAEYGDEFSLELLSNGVIEIKPIPKEGGHAPTDPLDDSKFHKRSAGALRKW